MRRILLTAAVALAACSSNNNNNGDPDSGQPDSGCASCTAWQQVTVDGTTSPNLQSSTPQLAIAVGPNDTVGMLWFEPVGMNDINKTIYELRYRSWKAGTFSAVEAVKQVEDLYGVNLTFGIDGEPIATYLGGPTPLPPQNGGAAYWFQNDAVLNYRSGGTWTEQVAATDSSPPSTGVGCDDLGNVVGLYPAVGVASDGTAYLAYRDVHYGQSPLCDFGGSDWEMAIGGPTSWSAEEIKAGGNDKKAYGGHAQMVMVNDLPAMVSDTMPDSANGPGSQVWFRKRTDAGTYVGPTSPILSISNLQSGPSLAYDPQLGFGVAAVNANTSELDFTSSPDGTSQWTIPDPAVQEGTGGWYPSLAISPTTHDPSIAYYFCSPNPSVAEGACTANADELRIAERVAGNWRISTVDTAGGFQPKLAFLSTGKRVILVRDPSSGVVKLEVEQ